jgi:hypothetical protein
VCPYQVPAHESRSLSDPPGPQRTPEPDSRFPHPTRRPHGRSRARAGRTSHSHGNPYLSGRRLVAPRRWFAPHGLKARMPLSNSSHLAARVGRSRGNGRPELRQEAGGWSAFRHEGAPGGGGVGAPTIGI